MNIKKDILEKVKCGILSVEEALNRLDHFQNKSEYDQTINFLIDDIIYDELFDFDKVVEIMKELNWEYFNGEQLVSVSKDSIKKTINNLIKEAIEGAINQYNLKEDVNYTISTGGFKVNTFIETNSDQLEIVVSFIPKEGYTSIPIKCLLTLKNK